MMRLLSPSGLLRDPQGQMAIAVALIVSFPLFSGDTGLSVGFVALQYVVFAVGLNIIVGWAGLLDLGAAGFVAVGAYATAILVTQLNLPPLVVLPLAAMVGAVTGVVLGLPTVRHRADYFAILTLGFAELVALTIRNWPAVTKGSYGYSGIPAFTIPFVESPFRALPPFGFYYLAAGIAIPSVFFCIWLRTTRFGRRCHLIKHNETVAASLGINVVATRLFAFAISSTILASGGYLWAVYQRSIIWTEFGVLLSCMLVSLLVVGGIGSPVGALVGAIVVAPSLEMLRRVLTSSGLPQNSRYLLFACLLVVAVRLRPRGIVPDRPAWFGRDRNRTHDRGISKPTPEAADSLLELRAVSKTYGGLTALQGIDLMVRRGERIAITGSNGSGKSTLANIICGHCRAGAGAVFFNGRRIDGMAAYQIARLGVARTFQDVCVFEDLDVADNVYLAARADPPNVVRSLERFGFSHWHRSCASLSYGEKKTLDLARAFVDPAAIRLAVLDEPTAGLSRREALDVVSSLAELCREHTIALIVVSHDLEFLGALSVDRTIVLNEGRIVRDSASQGVSIPLVEGLGRLPRPSASTDGALSTKARSHES